MANKLISLDRLTQFGNGLKEKLATKASVEEVSGKVTALEGKVITGITINGEADGVTVSKNVADITVPTTVAELEDASDYKTWEDTEKEIDSKVAALDKAHFLVVDEIPDPDEADPNILYLVEKEDGDENDVYDIYVRTGEEDSYEMTKIDDTAVDLTPYAKKTDVTKSIEDALKAYTTTEDLESDYVKSEGLQDTVEGWIEGYLTDDEHEYATKDYVDGQVAGVSSEITQSLTRYTTTADLEKDYLKKAELATEIFKADNNIIATEQEITSLLTSMFPTE